MDGRIVTALLTLVLPAVLIGVTAEYYSLNPISILVCVSVMVIGTMYLLSYTDTF
jgi:hypothetical protein